MTSSLFINRGHKRACRLFASYNSSAACDCVPETPTDRLNLNTHASKKTEKFLFGPVAIVLKKGRTNF